MNSRVIVTARSILRHHESVAFGEGVKGASRLATPIQHIAQHTPCDCANMSSRRPDLSERRYRCFGAVEIVLAQQNVRQGNPRHRVISISVKRSFGMRLRDPQIVTFLEE